MATRYKVTKEQLERVVESFVVESTNTQNLSEEELNEFFGKKKRKKELEDDYKLKSRVWASKGVIGNLTDEDFNQFMKDAESDNFEGKVGLDKASKKIKYRKSEDIKWATPGGHVFGSGQ
jgi:hypothetical protein